MASRLQADDIVFCREELQTVLDSKFFNRAPSLSKMLRFMCMKSLEGQAGSINVWTIAIDGLRRRNDFDPERDSIVRVEFHHLRKRLNQYYETEGANHVTRISLPDTGYVPRFITVPPAPPPPSPSPRLLNVGSDSSL
jgi:hypothetical protein